MKMVSNNLYCGSEKDFKDFSNSISVNIEYESQTFVKKIGCDALQDERWAILHACKEPYHRAIVGYATRGCPKESSEYLWAERGNILALNIVDAPKAEFFDKGMIDKALDFIDEKLKAGMKVLVHCNVGESRSTSICLLYLIQHGIIKGNTLEDCEAEFMKVYPKYNPGAGIRGFVKEHWEDYSLL